MAENLANDITTLIGSDISNVATTLNVTVATGFPAVNFRVRVEDELMLVTSLGTGLNWTVTRGIEGTTAVAHLASSVVSQVLTSAGLLQYITDRFQLLTGKDASGGYAGLTLFKLNMRNVADTFTSFFTNTNTAARTYTLPDKDGTVAMTSDITGTNSGTNTGDNATNTQYSGLAASKQDTSAKDATGGYVGLTLFKINFKNAANTFTNFFTNATTAARTYTFPDKDITVAGLVDITGTNSGTNTGDNAVNTLYSGLVSNATHTGDATGATALTVVKINGTLMSGLATGILKNTTGTGVPSIAVAGDFPTLNQNTTGNAATVGGYARRVDLADFTTWDATKVGAVGWYNFSTGGPSAGLYHHGWRTGMTDINYGSEIAVKHDTDNIYFRRYAAAYGSWRELYHTGNTTISAQFGSLGIGTAASGTAGEIRATNNITAYYSDGRLKDILGAIENPLECVRKLSGVRYKANLVAGGYGYDTNRVEIGVIAQEVQTVLPEIVTRAPFDIGQNEDGSEFSKSGQEYLTVHYERIIPLLIEAIKELTAKVEALEAR